MQINKIHVNPRESLHCSPGVADEQLHRDECLVSYVGVGIGHQLHYAGLTTQVGENPARKGKTTSDSSVIQQLLNGLTSCPAHNA